MNKHITLLVATAFVLSALAMFRDPVVDETDEPLDADRSLPMVSIPVDVAPATGEQVFSTKRSNALADSDLPERVAIKYRFLFADLRLDSAAFEILARYLLERESITQAAEKAIANEDEDASDHLGPHRQRLAEIDAGVEALLQPADRATYTALKDSDAEQRRLFQYLGGIHHVAPLDETQERAILEAKLRQKQRYQTVVRDCGLDRDTLSWPERE